jgi:hypothetical protein
MLCNWNDSNLKSSRRINWRASLVPAAAVIPAPKGYINVVAVKKLVVEFRVGVMFCLLGVILIDKAACPIVDSIVC